MAGDERPTPDSRTQPPGIDYTHPRRRPGLNQPATGATQAAGLVDYTHPRRRPKAGEPGGPTGMSGTADGSPRGPGKPIDYIRPARRRGQQNTDDNSLISIDFVDGENSPLTGPAEPMTPVSTRPSPSVWLPEQAHTGRTMGSSPELVGQLTHPGAAAGLPRAVIPLRRLGVLTKLAEGTQGVVSRTEQLRLNRTDPAVLKRYKAAVLTELDTPALTALVEFLFALPRAEGRSLLDSAAWPIRAVSDGDRTIGFVMPEVPDRYWIELSLPSGHRRRVPGQVQHLSTTMTSAPDAGWSSRTAPGSSCCSPWPTGWTSSTHAGSRSGTFHPRTCCSPPARDPAATSSTATQWPCTDAAHFLSWRHRAGTSLPCPQNRWRQPPPTATSWTCSSCGCWRATKPPTERKRSQHGLLAASNR